MPFITERVQVCVLTKIYKKIMDNSILVYCTTIKEGERENVMEKSSRTATQPRKGEREKLTRETLWQHKFERS